MSYVEILATVLASKPFLYGSLRPKDATESKSSLRTVVAGSATSPVNSGIIGFAFVLSKTNTLTTSPSTTERSMFLPICAIGVATTSAILPSASYPAVMNVALGLTKFVSVLRV